MPGIEFLGMEIDSITREGTKSCQDLSEPSQESFYNSSRIGQGYRSPIIYYTSNGTSKDSVQIFPTTTNYVSKGKNELSFSNNIKHQVKIQISLVHRELDVSQLRNFFSIESTHKWFFKKMLPWQGREQFATEFKDQGNCHRKTEPST